MNREAFNQISIDVIQYIAYYLNIDTSETEEVQFQNDVERLYTGEKKRLLTNYVWGFSVVHNYPIQTQIDTITGNRLPVMPTDFIKLVRGFDKQANWQAYDTSLINTIPSTISYIRYVYDNNTTINIPDYFHHYLAVKMASQLVNSNRWQTAQTVAENITRQLGFKKQDAIRQEIEQSPFRKGFNYNDA